MGDLFYFYLARELEAMKYNVPSFKSVLIFVGKVAFAIALTISIFALLMGLGSRSKPEPDIPVTDAENRTVSALEQECKCTVTFEHKYNLVMNLPTDTVGIFKEDSLAYIRFTWNSGKDYGKYNIRDDVYYYADTNIVEHALRVTRKLDSVISYKAYYKGYKVFYNTVNLIDNGKGKLWTAHEKYVVIDKVKDDLMVKAIGP